MTYSQDIAAIRASNIPLAEKRRQVYDLKGRALVNLLTPKVGQVFTRGVYTVQMTSGPEYDRGMLIFRGVKLTKNGVAVPTKTICIVNPALQVPDVTPGTFKEDLLLAARDTLIGLAG